MTAGNSLSPKLSLMWRTSEQICQIWLAGLLRASSTHFFVRVPSSLEISPGSRRRRRMSFSTPLDSSRLQLSSLLTWAKMVRKLPNRSSQLGVLTVQRWLPWKKYFKRKSSANLKIRSSKIMWPNSTVNSSLQPWAWSETLTVTQPDLIWEYKARLIIRTDEFRALRLSIKSSIITFMPALFAWMTNTQRGHRARL